MGLAWARLSWLGLAWSELGWPALACADLGWPAPAWAGLAAKVGMCRVGHGAPVQPRRCTELRANCRELLRIAPNHPGLPQTIWKYRELQWVTENNELSLFKGHRRASVGNRVGGRPQ